MFAYLRALHSLYTYMYMYIITLYLYGKLSLSSFSDPLKGLLIPNDPCATPSADGYTFSLNVSVVDETTRGEYSVEFTNRAGSITRGPVLVTPNGMFTLSMNIHNG